MIILQITEENAFYNDIYEKLYNQGKAGLMLLPCWIKLLAITNDDTENIKILPKEDS